MNVTGFSSRLFRHFLYAGVGISLVSSPCLGSDTLSIAKSGDNVPEGNGQFQQFSAPLINAHNHVVFSARLLNTSEGNADDTGIYRLSANNTVNAPVITIEKLVRENDFFVASNRSFHISELNFSSAYTLSNAPVSNFPAAGDFNNVAMVLPLVPNSGDFGNSIIAFESEDSFTLVAEALTQVESSNGVYKEFNAFSILGLSANNDVTYFAALDNTENGSQDNTAVFKRFNDDSILEIVRKGDGVNVGTLSHIGGIKSNDFGDSVFSGSVDAVNSNVNSGLYKITGSSFTHVVYEGDSAPTDGEASLFFGQLTEGRINNYQEVGFTAVLRDENGFAVTNGSGLFLADNLSIKTILVKGQVTPDGSAVYRDFSGGFSTKPRPALNDLAQFALKMDLLTESEQLNGIFRASETEVIEIARKGDVYGEGTLRNFQDPAINNNGLIVFQADLVVGEEIGDEGSYLILQDILIMSDGVHYETIEQAGNIYNGKTVRELAFNNNSNGPANGLSDSGKVAYRILYEDGTQSIHVWVPEFGWRLDATDNNWDDITNWHFGGLPNQFSDVVLDLEQDTNLQGPSEDTTINSLSLGGGAGSVQLLLNDTTFTVTNGLIIQASSVLVGQGALQTNIQNNGTIEILENQSFQISGGTRNDGKIMVNSGGELTFLSDFEGKIDINGLGNVSLNGELRLDDTPTLHTVEGNMNLSSSSTLHLKINGLERGVSFDAFDVGASLTLGGNLVFQVASDLSLKNGDTFKLLSADQIIGEFDTISLPTLQDQGLQLSINKTSSTIELIVSQIHNNVVEPEVSAGGGSISIIALIFVLLVLLIRVSVRLTHGGSKCQVMR